MSRFYNEIIREYDKKRQANHALREKRIAEACALCPGLEAVNREIDENGIAVVKAMLMSDDDRADFLYALREKNHALSDKRLALIARAGLPLDYLEEAFDCRECRDTGFVGDEKCACFIQKLIARHSEASGLSALHRKDSFKSFELRYYSDDINPKSGVSDRSSMEMVLAICKDFAKRFGGGNNLFLYGNTGLGKTLLCNAIANDLLDKGRTVMYFTASQLFKLIEDRRFKRDQEAGHDEMMELVYQCDLLIIDDLGTEFPTIITDTEFFNIINIRLIRLKSVIISTNLNHKAFVEHYSERISSRIFGNYNLLEFFGDDIRMKKKFGI